MTNAYILVGKHERDKHERDYLRSHCIEGRIRWILQKHGVRMLAPDRAQWLSTVNTVTAFRFRKWQRGAGPSDRLFASKGEPNLGSYFFRSHSHLEMFAK
jgi:hypothetical protein